LTDVGVASGVAYSEDGCEQIGVASATGDFDRDGNLDLVKTDFIEDTPLSTVLAGLARS
jgi:hypothetical protein